MDGANKRTPSDSAELGTRATADDEVEELAQAADALFYAMRRARSVASQASSGLTPAQLALLDPLAKEGELPVGRLAAAAEVSVPTATRMLQQLENKGSVTRRRSPTDERRVLVGLTEDGVHQVSAVRAGLRERQTRILTRIPPAERADLTRHLHRLADVIATLDD
ncbi:MarR family winged helix-turn-helix transcriptional regulator [Streptomyces sp. NPDC002795]|uniref:MarR family winged helix-turn-helix transcriptional regulator n=1 Tax=Streptomyces sp. NPDC002795 TaxID=3364665 RepID=UPI00367973D7